MRINSNNQKNRPSFGMLHIDKSINDLGEQVFKTVEKAGNSINHNNYYIKLTKYQRKPDFIKITVSEKQPEDKNIIKRCIKKIIYNLLTSKANGLVSTKGIFSKKKAEQAIRNVMIEYNKFCKQWN